MPRTIVVGDIHGCFDELTDLLDLIKLQKDDRVVAVGDLITKGPKDREVLDLFISDRRFSSVVGNHDRKIRQKLRGEPMRLTKEQRKTLVELERDREGYAAYLRSLPYTIDLGSHLVVHAGVRPGVAQGLFTYRRGYPDSSHARSTGCLDSGRGVLNYNAFRCEQG